MSSPSVLNPAQIESTPEPRVELAQCLNDATGLQGIDSATCGWLREKLSEEFFNLVAVGQFKRGKSTIINALLGEALLPVGVVPLTSVVTVIRSGPRTSARVTLRDGRTLPIEIDALAEYVTERGNPGNAKSVERVDIEHPSSWLANGVRLVDTPGIASIYEHNTDETHRFLPQADAVLLIASVDQPVSRAELDFLSDLRRYAGKTICLLNKTDHLLPEELHETMAFAVGAIRDALGPDIPVFAVSGKLALEGRLRGEAELLERSGFPEFEGMLRRFMAREKTAAWLRSIARSLARLLAERRFALDLESKVLVEPLERIEANLALFREEKEKAERARQDYRVLLEADARALLKEHIEPGLEDFKRSEQTRICAAITRWTVELRQLPPHKLQAAIEARMITAIRTAYEDWLAQQDVELSRAFQRLCARFWASLQQSVDELLRRSSELFALTFERTDTEPHWSTESGFYYKFWYEPTSLRILSTSVVLMLPRVLAAPLIAGRAKTAAVERVEVQAGRIRHDLEERLKKSIRDAQNRMLEQIAATVAGIEAAIENGISMRRLSSAEVSARSGEIEDTLQRIAELSGCLTRILSNLWPDDGSR
jgi:GTPase SAR1 family protein